MFFKHIFVVKNTGRVGYIRHRKRSLLGYEFQRFVDINVRLFDIRKARIIRNVR